MTTGRIEIETAAGVMPVQTFWPDAPGPAVILFMDAPGIRDELEDIARRVAAAGFFCLLPDLYYPIGYIRIDLRRRTEAHAEVYRVLAASLDNRRVADDTDRLLDSLPSLDGVAPGRAGCLGFSVGGRFAVQAPGLFPDRVGAAASICGTGLVTDAADSPHATLSTAINAVFALDFASDDPAVPDAVIATLSETLAATGQKGDILVHPATRHGFSFPIRPMYDAAAAELSLTRALDLFRQTLG